MHLKQSARRTRTKGFTLVEILVVMAIVGVLASVLFSVFARVREKGRSAVCQSNLHQIYLAMQQYVQDNDGRYPHHLDVNNSWWSHKLFPYIKNVEVFRCPTISKPLTPRDDPLYDPSYRYNVQRLNYYVFSPGLRRRGRAESEPALSSYSATIFLNACNPLVAETNGQTIVKQIPTSCGRVMELGGSNRHHSDGTNWSFLDGHVKWMTPEQLAELSCANLLDHIGPTTNP